MKFIVYIYLISAKNNMHIQCKLAKNEFSRKSKQFVFLVSR